MLIPTKRPSSSCFEFWPVTSRITRTSLQFLMKILPKINSMPFWPETKIWTNYLTLSMNLNLRLPIFRNKGRIRIRIFSRKRSNLKRTFSNITKRYLKWRISQQKKRKLLTKSMRHFKLIWMRCEQKSKKWKLNWREPMRCWNNTKQP